MKVGLVLGAGGVLGGAWLTGALDALAAETGWNPATADHIVGTSAGSMVGAFLAAGVTPAYMVARSTASEWSRSRRPSLPRARSRASIDRLRSRADRTWMAACGPPPTSTCCRTAGLTG